MNREKVNAFPTEDKIRGSAVMTVVCDVILILALVLCLLFYITRNNVNTYNQNVESITNLAVAKSRLMMAALDNTDHDIKSAYSYCRGRSIDEVMDYLALICVDGDEYQLLREADDSSERYYIYSGMSTKRDADGYIALRYEGTDLTTSLHQYAGRGDGQVAYSQSFTNKTDGLRYFSAFCRIAVEEDGQQREYYLVKPKKESTVLDTLVVYSQYSELDTAICYSDGKYLACDNSFRSDNFFSYIYKYNGLSVDDRNAIRANVQADADGSGILKYKDMKGRECIFAYALCRELENGYVIVSVPVSEFVSEKLLSFFPLMIIVFLVVLLTFNTWRLLLIVKQLRLSVEREKVANKSKSSFLSRMSHEIRTPLNAVIGYNAIARGTMNDAENDAGFRETGLRVMDCLNKSEIASRHLLTVINDVLDMSAIESGKIQVENTRFDFKGLITSLTTVFYSQAKTKGVEFEVVFDNLTEEWFVGDQMRTNQVLTNLLSNAIKFTPEGGYVKLKIQQPEADTNASHIHFEVSDSGIGMSEEYLEHIWQPFEQADSSISRRFGGSGLGLAITKNLVDLMGGSISVESSPGVGTCFSVDLTFERTEQPRGSSVYDFSAVNALVVDDDLSTCDYVRMLFNRCGARCAAVTCGEDAVKAVSLAREQGEEYTVCLVDWQMPGMDGLETIRRIRAVTGDKLPIAILTAYDFTELAGKMEELGINKLLAKPLFQSSLFDTLANLSGMLPMRTMDRSKSVDFSGCRVLLAEDNAMNMEIARTIMESTGLTVDCAWNGEEAVCMFEDSPADAYNAILMDVHMPVINGHEATRMIRASSHPNAGTIPIIAMTADAFAENVAEAHESGMNDHISKPIDIPVMFDVLAKYLKNEKTP